MLAVMRKSLLIFNIMANAGETKEEVCLKIIDAIMAREKKDKVEHGIDKAVFRSVHNAFYIFVCCCANMLVPASPFLAVFLAWQRSIKEIRVLISSFHEICIKKNKILPVNKFDTLFLRIALRNIYVLSDSVHSS